MGFVRDIDRFPETALGQFPDGLDRTPVLGDQVQHEIWPKEDQPEWGFGNGPGEARPDGPIQGTELPDTRPLSWDALPDLSFKEENDSGIHLPDGCSLTSCREQILKPGEVGGGWGPGKRIPAV